MKKSTKIFLVLLSLVLIIPLVGFGYLYFKLNSMYDKTEANEVKSKIEKVKEVNGITNILLVGVDGNNLDKGNRSDAMMILTLDTNNKNIRLTSLARDTYVNIPGYSEEKLTHAYAYEGPSLLLETIKDNFGIAIDKYVAVSFDSFVKIIDMLGGVDIDIISREISHIPGINNTGIQTLNGEQALAYSRIRYADSAYQRDNRQRTVIQSVYNKILSDSSVNYLDLVNNVLKYTKTNMNPLDIVGLVNKAIKIKAQDFDQMEFPLEGHRDGKTISKEKGWVIQWEKDYNKEQLNKFIYDYKSYNQK